MQLSSFLQLEPSATVQMNTLAFEKKRQGIRVYNLGIGEPMVPTHPAIVAAAIEALQAGKTHYPPVAGIPELRDAAAAWLNKNYGARYTANDVVVTCGGKHALFLALHALIEPGNEVLIFSPYWVSYPSMAKIFGGVPKFVTVTEANGWKVDPAGMEHAITAKTRFLIINNGANPTGVLYSREELSKILDKAAQHDLIIISDEVYSGLTYDNQSYVSAASFPEYKDRVVIIQSCSKHFAMTGWRVGFLFGPKNLVSTVTDLQSQSTTGTSSISQWAAVAALQHADDSIRSVRQVLQSRRNMLIATLQEMCNYSLTPPAAALYALVPLSAFGAAPHTESIQWCESMLDQHHVATVPGAPFGAEGYVRLSFGGDEAEIHAGIAQLVARNM